VEKDGFRSFKDLIVWQEARSLRQKMYALAKRLPDFEKFSAASQIRRAALSLTNNIAEGHGRYHYQENIQYLRQARGSLEELMDDLTLCEDEQYAPATEVAALNEDAIRVRRLLNACVRYLKERKSAPTGLVREALAAYETDTDEHDDNENPFNSLTLQPFNNT
jgi:four helix bundle protein